MNTFPGVVTFEPDHPVKLTLHGCHARWVARLNPPDVALPGHVITFAISRTHAEKHLACELYADVHGCEPEEVSLDHAWAWFQAEGFYVTWLA